MPTQRDLTHTRSKKFLAQRLGATVKAICRFQGMSHKQLGALAGLTEPQISRLLAGAQHWRELDIQNVADALRVDPGIFFETPQAALDLLGYPTDLIRGFLDNTLTAEQLAITSRYSDIGSDLHLAAVA